MKTYGRRIFLKNAAVISASLLTPGFLKSLPEKYRSKTGSEISYNGKKLVMIQLSGGNDGMNTLIPTRNDSYYRLRPGISISSDKAGLNPVMTGVRSLYDNGQLSIINSVGYPNPDRSHFRSMDIWQSASSSDEYLDTGWIGRYLDSDCSSCVHPYSAIEVDSALSMALKGRERSGIAIKDPSQLYSGSKRDFFSELARSGGTGYDNDELAYLYKTLSDITLSSDYIYENSSIYKSAFEYPSGEFCRNLKTIAGMINSGFETSVYYVSLSGFDTHVGQTGRHERLLKELSDGIKVFSDDLAHGGTFGDTLIVCFSEFGRRVKENGSKGTDHGSANNLFIIGGNLKSAGLYNKMPDLEKLVDGDIIHEIDFRSVYSTILRKWLGADDVKILGKDFGDMKFC